MSTSRYDVIIAGARCAGATLAYHLARAGLSVAVVDAAPLPSGQPMSTHLIQPPGMDEFDAIGVGDTVRRLAPALPTVRLEFDGSATVLTYGVDRAAFCLRRTELDVLVQQAAMDAGACIRSETRVVDLVRDEGGRVRGVEVQVRGDGTGKPRDRLLADVVVGADGRSSTVAKLVGAGEYLGYDAPRGCYWAYWRRPAAWDPHMILNSFRGREMRTVFPTDGDLLLVATAPPIAEARAWRGDHRAAYLADVRSYEPLASALGGDEPVSEVRGVVKSRYFFRVPCGPGWALAGDAGHHKDFMVGLGISDALRDARSLAGAIVDGGPVAFERYWRQRDVDRIEIFHWSRQLGAADRVDGLERLIARRGAQEPHPALQARLGAVIDGDLSPFDLIPAPVAVRWVAGELVRGRVGAVVPLMATGVRAVRARLARLHRGRLLAAVPASDGPAGQIGLTTTSPSMPKARCPGRWHANTTVPGSSKT